MKYSFKNDYSELAHPKVLSALEKISSEQLDGYGEDGYSKKAIKHIRQRIDENVDVHFVPGGTQTNLIALASMMKPYESVVAPKTGHINVHEAGAIEATGHKINAIKPIEGKINPDQIEKVIKVRRDEHMVKPKVVFVSNSTEVGTIYTENELKSLSVFCRKNELYLYLDGARLGAALSSSKNDLDLSQIAEYVDMFYIGGTKNGAILGEALIIVNDELKDEFRRHIKQRGAMLAKGSVLGIQFLKLFEDDLYFKLASHANKMADMLREGIQKGGYKFLTNSPTNQIFPILPNEKIDELRKLYGFYKWSDIDENNSSIRLVTSWATKEVMIREFLNDLKK